jgi:hypothetical protein
MTVRNDCAAKADLAALVTWNEIEIDTDNETVETWRAMEAHQLAAQLDRAKS